MTKSKLHILLADDDSDDRFFFEKALSDLPINTDFTTVEDGEKLMFLLSDMEKLPDVLFLDLNMPRKNGSECLREIKKNAKLSMLPVIIYSTSLHDDIADLLYNSGAHYYIRKTDSAELKKVLNHITTLMLEKKFARPHRVDFIITMASLFPAQSQGTA